MSTEAQVIANRQNAIFSTGAVTVEGKAIVAGNAIKHGIFAKTFLVNHSKYQENISEYQELLNGLVANFNPLGQMEQLLVEKIAIDYWRVRRVLKFETDQIYNHIQFLGSLRGSPDRLFINDEEANKISRYESHLQKMLLQNITMLKQMQQEREQKENGFVL